MSAKPKPAPQKPVDEWEKFRPIEASRRRSSRSTGSKLLIACALFIVLVLMWVSFKPSISGTVAEIRRAVAEFGEKNVASNRPRVSSPPAARRGSRPSPRDGESLQNAARAPGPFEVYLLDGDRYVRVDSSSKSVLLNMQTGETTWTYSDAVEAHK